MAELNFTYALECIQTLESIPTNILTGNEGLHLGNIHFMPLWCSISIQQISMVHPKDLVGTGFFQLPGYKSSQYSSLTTILIVFVSDEELMDIKHTCLSMVVHCVGLSLAEVAIIEKFLVSIQTDLDLAREKCCNGTGSPLSYSAQSPKAHVTNLGVCKTSTTLLHLTSPQPHITQAIGGMTRVHIL